MLIVISMENLNLLYFVLIIIATSLVDGADYNFIPEDEKIFSKCPQLPKSLGITGLLDVSAMKFEYNGESVHIEGDVKNIWETKENDRIAVRAGLYRWKRGLWEPTILNMVIEDFCKDMWRTDREWYHTWGQYVAKDSRKCLNVKGNVYRQSPFDVALRFNNLQGTNWAGRYKIEIVLEAFDKEGGNKRPDTICINILGELEKI